MCASDQGKWCWKCCSQSWQSGPAWLGPPLLSQGITAPLANEHGPDSGKPGCSQPLQIPPAICHHCTAAQQDLLWKACSTLFQLLWLEQNLQHGGNAGILFFFATYHPHSREKWINVTYGRNSLISIPIWETCNNQSIPVEERPDLGSVQKTALHETSFTAERPAYRWPILFWDTRMVKSANRFVCFFFNSVTAQFRVERAELFQE